MRGDILGYYNVLIISGDLQPRPPREAVPRGEMFVEKKTPKNGKPRRGVMKI